MTAPTRTSPRAQDYDWPPGARASKRRPSSHTGVTSAHRKAHFQPSAGSRTAQLGGLDPTTGAATKWRGHLVGRPGGDGSVCVCRYRVARLDHTPSTRPSRPRGMTLSRVEPVDRVKKTDSGHLCQVFNGLTSVGVPTGDVHGERVTTGDQLLQAAPPLLVWRRGGAGDQQRVQMVVPPTTVGPIPGRAEQLRPQTISLRVEARAGRDVQVGRHGESWRPGWSAMAASRSVTESPPQIRRGSGATHR